MDKKTIEIVKLDGESRYEIVPSKIKREILERADNHTYRCKPINVANTYGWNVLCPNTFTAHWNGGPNQEDIAIECYDESICVDCAPMTSHFGCGVLTFIMDFIIRTDENTSLYVRSPTNTYVDGIQPLDAIVETDWLPFTFTYNFKFLKPGKIDFVKGEPLYTFFPIERGFIESFETKVSSINDYPEFKNEYQQYLQTRTIDNHTPVDQREKNMSGFYRKGENASGKKYEIKNHSNITNLKPFTENA
jgi:hypothetical protein